MFAQESWQLLKENICDRPSPPRMFNPYRDINGEADRPDAAERRKNNLKGYLQAFDHRPPLFFLAEAPGPWGCRFSGVPITSEAQLVDPAFPITGMPSSLKDTPHTEYSASTFWRVMLPYFPHFFVWNAVPFHPHEEGEPFSIRNPGRREARLFQSTLGRLLQIIRPDHIVAIGRKAERSLNEISQSCTYVRHPSQGGANQFRVGVHDILRERGIQPTSSQG